MVDAVLNNMAYAGPGASTDYSMFTPFNKEEYYHPFCYISDYGNDTNAQTVSSSPITTPSHFTSRFINQYSVGLAMTNSLSPISTQKTTSWSITGKDGPTT